MWILPSRSRPDTLKAFLDRWTALGCVQPLLIVIDENDPRRDEYLGLRLPASAEMYVQPGGGTGTGDAFQYGLARAGVRSWYGLMADDVVPEMPGWDTAMPAACGAWGVSFAADSPGNCTYGFAICLGGELVRAVGYIKHPSLSHLGIDNFWNHLARDLGTLVPMPHCVIRRGPELDEKPFYAADRAAWQDLRFGSEWPQIVARVRAKVPAVVGRPLIVCCVKWGTRYGAEYVNILRDMVARSLVSGLPGEFWCFTDDPVGLDPGVVAVPLPMGADGWWNKLAMFEPGVFPPDARVVYFDLDTIITGRIDPMVNYDGDFAILRDFYRPDGYGSGVMLWRGGWGSHIWERWVAAGRPDVPGGDQSWIEMVQPKADRLQDLFPGLLCSFKRDCKPFPPKGAHVVCFHGEPKPHNCGQQWVADVWQVGGTHSFDLDVHCNVEGGRLLANVRSACARPLPWLAEVEPHERHAVIVGGGPSSKRFLEQIKARQRAGHSVIALNGAQKLLLGANIRPDAQVICDARPISAKFAVLGGDNQVFIASQCDPLTFDIAAEAGRRVTVFHPNIDGIVPIVESYPERGACPTIGGGSTVGLQAMVIAFIRGFRTLHLYGFDSSYEDAEGHAYAQPENDGDRILDVVQNGRKFRAAPWMVGQAQEFQIVAEQLRDADCEIHVHGDGLLPHIARQMAGAPSSIAAA